MKKRRLQANVHIPKILEDKKYVGSLYGNFFSNSNHYNIIEYGENKTLPLIGRVFEKKEDILDVDEDFLVGYYYNKKLYFLQNGKKCKNNIYELTLNIFSRNSGILETDKMLNKSVIISGCGSVGSLVALELARSGVGNFLLIDNDVFEYHNICRHQCSIQDVGKFKVDAIEERILEINPNAKILKQSTILERVPEKVFENFCNENTLIIGCADNREGDLYANKISYSFNIPFISIGFWERAFAGEIFYSIPHETPCYYCQFGNMPKEEDARATTNHRVYVHEKELEETKFEPGISVDINFVTIIGIKLSLDILNRYDSNYIPKVINHLTQYTFICNTNDIRIGGDMAEIFAYPLQVTTSVEVHKSENCKIC